MLAQRVAAPKGCIGRVQSNRALINVAPIGELRMNGLLLYARALMCG